MPLNDLIEMARKCNLDYLVTSFSSNINDVDTGEYVRKLAAQLTDKILIIGGAQIAGEFGKIPGNVRIVDSVESYKAYLDQLNTLPRKFSEQSANWSGKLSQPFNCSEK